MPCSSLGPTKVIKGRHHCHRAANSKAFVVHCGQCFPSIAGTGRQTSLRGMRHAELFLGSSMCSSNIVSLHTCITHITQPCSLSPCSWPRTSKAPDTIQFTSLGRKQWLPRRLTPGCTTRLPVSAAIQRHQRPSLCTYCVPCAVLIPSPARPSRPPQVPVALTTVPGGVNSGFELKQLVENTEGAGETFQWRSHGISTGKRDTYTNMYTQWMWTP